MLKLLFANNFDFIVSVIAGFTFLAGGWLYLDSWKVNKEVKSPLLRCVGFFVVSISFFLRASQSEFELIIRAFQIFRVIGYVLIFTSLVTEPILPPPSKSSQKTLLTIPFASINLGSALLYLVTAIGSGANALIYFIKSTKGYEKQLKLASFAFLYLFLSDFLRIFFIFSNTKTVFWSYILAERGLLWFTANGLEFVGIIILFIWIWGYLRFRIQPQLFIITLGLTISIFVTIAVSFTYLTLRNLEKDLLHSLQTNTRLLQYSIERSEFEALAGAQSLASENTSTDFSKPDEEVLGSALFRIAQAQALDLAAIVNNEGVIVVSINESEVDSSIETDPLFISARDGNPLSNIIIKQTSTTPQVFVEAAVPVLNEKGEITAVAKAGYLIDSAFTDGVKDVTGLEVTVFAQDTRSSSTLMLPDAKTRYVGAKEVNASVIEKVFKNSQSFTGKNNILNTMYYASYEPLKGLNNETVGMLSVTQPEAVMSDNLEESSNSTFIVSIILVALSIIPAYFIARYIGRNITA